MKNNNRRSITGRGIARASGLDVLTSFYNYTGEYINFGNAFAYASQLNSDTDHATTSATPITDSLINSPASVKNRWYRFHTSGSPYVAVSAPLSTGGYFIFTGQKTGSAVSLSGMYQRLSGLIPNNDYQVSVQNAISSGSGTLFIQTYVNTTGVNAVNYRLASSNSIAFPITNNSTGISKTTFTAQSPSDIIVIYFTTTETSSTTVAVTDISIEEKQEYLIPIYANDFNGNAHKVLRQQENLNAVVDETND